MSEEYRTLGAYRSAARSLPVGDHAAADVQADQMLTDSALVKKMITLQKLYADLDRQSRCDTSVPRAALTADQFYNDYSTRTGRLSLRVLWTGPRGQSGPSPGYARNSASMAWRFMVIELRRRIRAALFGRSEDGAFCRLHDYA